MKCILFGGGGFIGSAFADRLLLDGHSIRIFEKRGVLPHRNFKNNENIEWMTGDFQNKNDIDIALEGMDIVLHLISTTLPKNSNDDLIFDVQSNLIASLQMLNAMVKQKVKRIIFISSGGTVYGLPLSLPITETHPTNPLVSYGITKLSIEKYLLHYNRFYDIKPTILRVANPFGERQRIETDQGAASVFIHRALRREPIDIWGDGTITRDYIYIENVADALSKAIHYQGDQFIFNISSGTGTSINELITNIEEITGNTIVRRYYPQRAFDVQTNVLDNSLAKNELSWRPQISLRDGLIKTAQWIKTQL
jgi:UDP-glucose 4-epimerase